MAFRWRVDDGPTLNAGLVALWFFKGSGPVLLRDPLFLRFFRGRGSGPPVPPLDPHMQVYQHVEIVRTVLVLLYNTQYILNNPHTRIQPNELNITSSFRRSSSQSTDMYLRMTKRWCKNALRRLQHVQCLHVIAFATMLTFLGKWRFNWSKYGIPAFAEMSTLPRLSRVYSMYSVYTW